MSRDTSLQIVSGRLVKDAEQGFMPDGKEISKFTLACNESDTKCDFYDCQAYEKTAEIINQYCKKGSKILVTGRPSQQRWDDKETGQPRQKQVIKVQSFEFMGGKRDEE